MTKFSAFAKLLRPAGVLLLAGLMACAPATEQPTRNAPLLANLANPSSSNDRPMDRFQATLEGSNGNRRSLGTDEFLSEDSPPARDLIQTSDDGEYSLNLVNVSIDAAARAVLGEALDRSYTVREDVSGTVTLQTTRPLSERALLETFQTILELNGAVMQVNDELITILPASGATNQEGGSLQNVITFIPSTRLNAVLVVTSRQRYLADAEQWIRDLDRSAGGATRRPVVYNLQNRSAVDLEPILSEMLQEVAAEEVGIVRGSARIVADETKNAIVVWGNDTEQESLSRLIHSLDTTPVQVLLEATIAEVALNDELNFGLRWFFEGGGAGATLSDASNGSTGANFPGLSLVFDGASSAAAINALNSITTVNVVSSPSLMVLDNEEATLQIGDEVPVATQQVRDTSDANAPVVNTISFRDTGIILTVRPRVSSSGQVLLEINQEVSSVSNTTTSGIDSPTISQRRIETTVAVSDGQTIALGGLIQESNNRTDGQVPGVGDVPVLGALFRNRNDVSDRTELLILITPRVVRDGHESRAVTDELRTRIGAADGLIQTGISTPTTVHRIID